VPSARSTTSWVTGCPALKARRIVAGESPDVVLGGRKVRAFNRALVGDESAEVVDVWMLRAAGYRSDRPTPRVYETVARALRKVAARVAVPVARLQAVVWVVARGRAGWREGMAG
jgi:hypothetical protein